MKTLKDLKDGDYIAFAWQWNGDREKEVWVSNITTRQKGYSVVHFLYGHHSISEIIKDEEVIAIGNPDGTAKMPGWRGSFDVLLPDHELLKEK
jgi:hypothetical protein